MHHDNTKEQTSIKLSVCLIVKNEAALLGRCLSSVQAAADEIVVVDTGSVDETKTIARGFNAKVIESDWRDDFSYSRNISIEHATGKWILWLDADDVVPQSSIAPLCNLKNQPAACVYSFIVRNERPGNTGTEFTQARMFPNRPELRFERSIHEQIMPSALRIGMKLEPCGIIIEHHGYADPQTLKKKAGRNIRLLLQEYPRIAPDPVMAAEIADSYWLIDDSASAEKWYREVISLTGEKSTMPALTSHAYYGLGNICNKREQFADAVNNLEQARRYAPWRPDVLYSMAVAFEFLGDMKSAVKMLSTITSMEAAAGQVGVDFRSARIKAYLRLMRIVTENGRFGEAGNIVCKAVAEAGNRPEIHNSAGKFYLKNGELIKALHAFEKSLQLRKDGNIEAYIGLCIVYLNADRREVAVATLDAIAPQFSGDERYIAARNMLLGEPRGGIPEDIEFEKLYESLKKDFFGML